MDPENEAALQTPEESAEVEEVGGQAPADAGEQVEPTTSKETPEQTEDVAALKRRLGEMRDELGRLRTLVGNPFPQSYPPMAPAAAPASAPNPEPFSVEVDESEWFGDPKKAAAKVAAAAAKQAAAEATKAAREEAALASRTAQIEAQFYGRFKDLSPEKHGRLVNAFAEDFAREVGQMDPYRRAAIYPDPMKSVHDKVREYLDGLAEEARTKPKSTPPLHVAPGGGAAPAVAPATSAKPQTEKERFDSYMASLRAMTNR